MSRIEVLLQDSWLEPKSLGQVDWKQRQASVLTAACLLSEALTNGQIDICSVSGRTIAAGIENVLQVQCRRVRQKYGSATVPDELVFCTSHYVGQAMVEVSSDSGKTSDQVLFRIEPRFGTTIRDRLLSCAFGVYLPRRMNAIGSVVEGNGNAWLLFLMWRCALEKAMKLSSIPKGYVRRKDNLRHFRGRLDVMKHIRTNVADQSWMFCDYPVLTMDTTINRTIRNVFRKAANSPMVGKSLLDIFEYDAKLASFGVSNDPFDCRLIDRIAYTRMSECYRPVMRLSKIILEANESAGSSGTATTPSYFVDMAEVWEHYLLHVMRKRLPKRFTVVAPNDMAERWFLFHGMRGVRPDFMVYDGDRLVAVIDAKYKRYETIGKRESDWGAVSRDDLYQMATYLYRFASPALPAIGIFVSPQKHRADSPVFLTNCKNHAMVVCNLEVPAECNQPSSMIIEKTIDENERRFSCRLAELLEEFSDKRRILQNDA